MEAERQKKKKKSEGKKRKRGTAWKNVTPEDPFSLLVGSGEGGFVSLEEIDEDLTFGLERHDGSTKGASLEADNNAVKSKRKRKKPKNPSDSLELESVNAEAADKPTAGRRKRLKKNKPGKAAATKDASERGGESADLEDEESIVDVSEWTELRVHPLLVKAIAALGFKSPTPIQKACIPAAAHRGKDVIGAAETGSGKTLAFGIPILQRLLEEKDKLSGQEPGINLLDRPLRALIVTPTRELALQICDHLRAVAKLTDFTIVPIVGGISTQKQQRLLRRRPPIIVGTPGRLWELMSSGENHLLELESLSFFILDEADRMIEKGHFQELQSIIDMLPQKGSLNKRIGEADATALANNVTARAKKRRQTLVFSATLTLPPDFKKKLKKGFGASKTCNQQSLAILSQRAGISPDGEVVDLTSKDVVAQRLTESVIECTEEEKDAYLYYVLKVHGCGRAIVFCTSIAAVRRVSAILRLLRIPAWPLHAQLQQRQRLKTMDRFRSSATGVLVATDVAARGLDIPGVRTVIHFQLPHSAEMYVHRSGRTARADRDGCSIALICPSESSKYLTLCRALSKTSGLISFPVDPAYLSSIDKRISLALKIDKISRQQSQTKSKQTWLERHARELEIDLDNNEDSMEESNMKAKQSSQLKILQEELKQLLDQPLESKAFSRRYVAGAGLTALAAQQLKEYVSSSSVKPNVGKGRLVVIGQEEIEPLQALQKSRKSSLRGNQ